jgi:hypothetical protein
MTMTEPNYNCILLGMFLMAIVLTISAVFFGFP